MRLPEEIQFAGEVRDPIHGDIKLTEKEFKVIDSPYFQRLRDVSQLPTVHLVYPAATHSRFSHSIGVLETATKIVTLSDSLRLAGCTNKEKKDIKTDTEKIEALRIAALLHDVEEPPFDRIFKEKCLEYSISINGQRMSIEDGLHALKKNIVKRICMDANLDYNFIWGILNYPRTKNNEFQLIYKILDSEVGANKLDYLMRDAYFCGVEYGRRIDPRIFSEFVNVGNDLAMKPAVVPLVETVFESLYQMRAFVYNHKVTRAGLSLVCKAIEETLRAGSDLSSLLLSKGQVENLLKGDKEFLESLSANENARKLIRQLENRDLPKRAYELDVYKVMKQLRRTSSTIFSSSENLIRIRQKIEKEIVAPLENVRYIYFDLVPPVAMPSEKDSVKISMNGIIPIYESSRILGEWKEYFVEQWKMYVFGSKEDTDKIGRRCLEIFGFLQSEEIEPKTKIEEILRMHKMVHADIRESEREWLKDTLLPSKELVLVISRLKPSELDLLKSIIRMNSATVTKIMKVTGRSRTSIWRTITSLYDKKLVDLTELGREKFYSPDKEVVRLMEMLNLI